MKSARNALPPSFTGLVLALGLPALASAQQWRTGQVADAYAQNCASCHGANMEGGQAPSMLDDVWTYGSDDETMARIIRDGIPEKGMPPWAEKFDDKAIRAMVIYIHETREKFAQGQIQFPTPKESMTVETQLHAYQLNTWVADLKEPYSLAFLPGDRAVVTEKTGGVFTIDTKTRAKTALTGLPAIETGGQGGLYDVVPHPDYARNGWLYFAFADPLGNRSMTRIIRGKIRGNSLVEQQNIYQSKPEHYVQGRVHWGGRIAFDRDNYLFFTIGERGQRDHAQELGRPNGKVHRLHDDGRIPADNPFVKTPGAEASIWSYGHRNPQGLAFDPRNGDLYDLEHGPRGGDELNLVEKGKNYGWPVITYGMEYSGAPITELTHKEGMEQPVVYWVPSLAVCGMNFYTGDLFPKWKNQLFITALAGQELRRLEIQNGKVVVQETIFKNIGRLRHVVTGPDGALYVMLPDRVSRLAPAAAGTTVGQR
jgi:glucose/arabinose dehydrogenase